MASYDLVVVGDVNPDLVVYAPELEIEFGQRETIAERAELLLGGSSAITACAAARLGLRVAFLGLVGDDAYGRFCLDALRSHGVDIDAVVVDADVPTGLTVILQRAGDRAILTAPGTIVALAARHIDAAVLARSRHLHVGSYFLLDGLRSAIPALFDAVHSHGGTTSLDPNDDPARRFAIDAVLDRCDVLLPNDHEACVFAGVDDPAAAARLLAGTAGTVAVTLGADGALAARNDELITITAVPIPATEVVDVVGAGDNFDAGFLFGHLQGWPLMQCLRAGVGAAAMSLRGHGGTGALGPIEAALALTEAA